MLYCRSPCGRNPAAGTGVSAAGSSPPSTGAADSVGGVGAPLSSSTGAETSDTTTAAATITTAAESSMPIFFQKPALKNPTSQATATTSSTARAMSVALSASVAVPALHSCRMREVSPARESSPRSLSHNNSRSRKIVSAMLILL